MRIEARSKGRITIPDDQRVVLDHARLDGENYSGRTLLQFASIGSHLHACNFDRVQIQSAAFGSGRETSEFVDCTFNGARMTMAPGRFSRFVRCAFHNVNIRNWICLTVEMIDCKFSGRLNTAIFNGAVPEDERAVIGRVSNEFHGNDFSAMDLIDVGFRTGIDLTKQILPSGEDYLYLPQAAAAVAQAKSRVVILAGTTRKCVEPRRRSFKDLSSSCRADNINCYRDYPTSIGYRPFRGKPSTAFSPC